MMIDEHFRTNSPLPSNAPSIPSQRRRRWTAVTRKDAASVVRDPDGQCWWGRRGTRNFQFHWDSDLPKLEITFYKRNPVKSVYSFRCVPCLPYLEPPFGPISQAQCFCTTSACRWGGWGRGQTFIFSYPGAKYIYRYATWFFFGYR